MNIKTTLSNAHKNLSEVLDSENIDMVIVFNELRTPGTT